MAQRSVKVLVGVLVLGSLAASQASAAKPTPVPQINSATLRDASGDVALSDGGGSYLSSETSGELRDFTPSQPDGDLSTPDQDYLSWGTFFGGTRFTKFNNAWASSHAFGLGSTEPISCQSGRFFFISESTPDFVEVLRTVGASVTGFASTGCWTSDTFKYQANYEPVGGDECVTLTRSSETTLTLTAPAYSPLGSASCLAVIYTFDGSSGTYEGTQLGRSSAPFEVTFAISTGGPGNGKGHGKGHGKPDGI